MSQEMMKAVGLHHYLPIEDPNSLIDAVIEKPVPTGRDLLIQVKAISVNPVDTKVRAPKDRVENQLKVLGWDVAGVVEQIGPDVTLFQPGDEVYYAGSIVRPGGNSEFHLADERIVGQKPSRIEFAEAAALPLTAITAWEGLFDRLGVSLDQASNKGKSILIIGAAGGVGSIAVQLAQYAGLNVIGTASRPESMAWVKEKGAHHVINHYESFKPQLEAAGFHEVDYVFCLNRTEQHWRSMAEVIAPQGRICSIVETKEALDLTLLMDKSATFVWEFMFTRSKYQTDDMTRQHHLLNEVARLVDQGIIGSTVAEKLSPINAENLREAHRLLETGRTVGKIVLERF